MKKQNTAKPGWGTLIASILLVLLINNDISQVFNLLLAVTVTGGFLYVIYRFFSKHPLLAWLLALFGLTNS